MMENQRGIPGYAEAQDPQYGTPHLVPLRPANNDSLKGYGHLVKSFQDEEVIISTWPAKSWRPIMPGTGRNGGVATGDFRSCWKDDVITAQNEAVDGDYIIGRLPADVSQSQRTHVLTRDANYHPDGGQVFYPVNQNAFVLLLALPGDDVTLEDFVAFHFDGACGVQIYPEIWHQGVFPIDDEATFMNKQGKVHASVGVDTVEEFGKFLKVPLVL